MLWELSAARESDSTKKIFVQICVFTLAMAGPSVWKMELSHFIKENQGSGDFIVADAGILLLWNKCHSKISQSEHVFSWNASKGQFSSM